LCILPFIAENVGQKTIAVNPDKKEPRLLRLSWKSPEYLSQRTHSYWYCGLVNIKN